MTDAIPSRAAIGLTEDRTEIREVPAAERDVWTNTLPIRCYHEDARGRCRRRKTRPTVIWNDGAYLRVDYLCEKHTPERPA